MSLRCSFFVCNTQASDDTEVKVDRFTQTYESGGLTNETGTQTITSYTFTTVCTDNVLSSTTLNSEVEPEHESIFDFQFEDSNSEPVENAVFSTSDSYTNTILSSHVHKGGCH